MYITPERISKYTCTCMEMSMNVYLLTFSVIKDIYCNIYCIIFRRIMWKLFSNKPHKNKHSDQSLFVWFKLTIKVRVICNVLCIENLWVVFRFPESPPLTTIKGLIQNDHPTLIVIAFTTILFVDVESSILVKFTVLAISLVVPLNMNTQTCKI